MKTITRYIKLCFLTCLVSLMSSCSDKTGTDPVQEQEGVITGLSLEVRSGYSAGTLNYGVYIFQSVKDANDFRLVRMSYPFVSGSKLNLSATDPSRFDYRFLFIALPENVSERTVITEYGEPQDPLTGLSPGCLWSDVRFNDSDIALTGDYYYGVTEMSGQEILDAGEVNGILDRVVGQMVYDIFKTGGTVSDPEGVPSTADVTSVLDRVYRIDITYTGVTRRLMFDGTTLIPDLSAGTDTYTETIDALQIGIDPITGKVTPGEKSSGTVIESYVPQYAEESLYTGAVRIRGAYLLPATDGITVSMVFHYYDTTPACNNSSEGDVAIMDNTGKIILDYTHESMEACFPTGSISLSLPKTGSLGIQSNYFTANKAGIPCNRVIEVPVNKGFGVDTDWNVITP